MNVGDIYHLAAEPADGRFHPTCGAALVKWVSPLPTIDRSRVNCPVCLSIMAGSPGSQRLPVTQEERMADQRRQWTIEAAAGDTDLGLIDWLKEKLGIGSPTPRHTPPRMEDERGMTDGVFIFTDVHHGEGYTLEVVPQLSGNVEITLESSEVDDGRMFTLHHLDRADLLRALLHDFHYSPERFGPNDSH